MIGSGRQPAYEPRSAANRFDPRAARDIIEEPRGPPVLFRLCLAAENRAPP